jgi:hypothetical protein
MSDLNPLRKFGSTCIIACMTMVRLALTSLSTIRNGHWVAVRPCDGQRTTCDRLATEFQAFDEDIGRALRRRR